MPTSIEQIRVAAIYNPQTQTKTQLIEGFVVRQQLFKNLFKAIKEAKMEVPEQHYLLLGRRGMGKTTLLLRLAYEVENDPALNSWLIPLVFNEEEYGIRRLFNFWERILELLEQQHPDFRFEEAERRQLSTQYKDDDAYERALFERLSNELQRFGKKLILFIDNFGDMARKMTDAEAHRLRKILQTSSDLRIMAASAVVLEAFYRYDHPFYEFFKVVELKGLDKNETRELLLSLSEHYKKESVVRIVEQHPGRVEALRRITGGVIRSVVLLFEIFADDDDGSAFKDLEIVLDRVTPLYKHRMDDLSDQQQAIVEAIALNWDALNVKEIAERTRLESKIISAQLQNLEKNGIVQKIPTKTKNHLYQVAERFFNIWYLMRNGRRGDEKRVRWLVHFFEEWCDGDMMKTRAKGHRSALRKGGFDPEAAFTYTQALAQTQQLALSDRHELLRDTRDYLLETAPELAQDLQTSDLDLAFEGIKAWFEGEKEVAMQILDKIVLNITNGSKLQAFKQSQASKETMKFWETEMYNFATYIGSIFYNLSSPELAIAEKCWSWVAEVGNANAMCNLGLLFQNKRKDIENAIKWYEKAATMGHAGAMLNLGLLFDDEKKDLDKAIEWYEKAAVTGDADAMYNLGLLFKNEKEDLDKAIEWYEKAAVTGDADAMYNLGVVFQNEKKDIEKAMEWYEKAATAGNTTAMNNLGQVFQYEKKDVGKALEWYGKAATTGHVNAMYNLGRVFQNEKKDFDKAVEWYEKAAALGGANAMFSLGFLFQNEKKDFDKAVEWYEKAAALGGANAMFRLGFLFQNEKDNIEKAIEWYEKAAAAGDTDAMFNLGLIFDSEKEDLEKAIKWYEKAAEKGDTTGKGALAYVLFRQNKQRQQSLELVTEYLKKDLKNDDYYDSLMGVAACILAWNNRLQESKNLASLFFRSPELIQNATDDITTYLLLMLAKDQAPWLLDLFNSPEGEAVQLKDRFKPIYYAILKKLDHPDFLRMGEELAQTVNEILVRAEEMAVAYA